MDIITLPDSDTHIEVISFSGTSTQSSALVTGSGKVRLCSDKNCYILFGTNPTVTTSNGIFLPARHVELFGCKADDKIAVIRASNGDADDDEGASNVGNGKLSVCCIE